MKIEEVLLLVLNQQIYHLKKKFLSRYKDSFSKVKDIIFIDGVRINFDCDSWIHIRKSNTEPIIRIISESNSRNRVTQLMNDVIIKLKNIKQ